MRCYLTFSDEDIFKSITLPEEMSTIQIEEDYPQSAMSTPVSTPEEEATMGMARESIAKRPPNKFPGWEKVLYPSQPLVAARQMPHLLRGLRLREERLVQIPQTERLKVMTTRRNPPCLHKSWKSSGE